MPAHSVVLDFTPVIRRGMEIRSPSLSPSFLTLPATVFLSISSGLALDRQREGGREVKGDREERVKRRVNVLPAKLMRLCVCLLG